MKKIVVWFSAVLLVLSLAACGNSTESAENNDTETTNSQPATDGSGSSGQEENVSVNDDSEKETGASQDTVSRDNGDLLEALRSSCQQESRRQVIISIRN